MLKCLFIGIGGFIGSVLRYLIGLIPLNETHSSFPFKTLAINVIGSFLIALFASKLIEDNTNQYIILMLRVGLCGGFTTFSTFAYEINELFLSGSRLLALLYILLSVVLSTAAVYSGIKIFN